jgi:phosphonate transport system substrate-binding protein
MRQSLLNGEVDGLGLTSKELMRMDIRPEHVFVGNRGDDIYIHYVVVAHMESEISSPKDLLHLGLATTDNSQMAIAREWLDILIAEAAAPGAKIDYPEDVNTLSKAILQVFFRQADAALVTRSAFDLAGELNPQIREDIEVLWESPPLVTGLFILQPASGNQDDWNLMERSVLGIDKTPGGRQLLTVIKSSRLEKRPLADLEDTFNLLEKHGRLVEGSIFQGITSPLKQ